jgi:hypothetical protein
MCDAERNSYHCRLPGEIQGSGTVSLVYKFPGNPQETGCRLAVNTIVGIS